MASIFEQRPEVIQDPVDKLSMQGVERAAALVIARRLVVDGEDVDDMICKAVYICDGPAAAAEFYAERKAADSALEMQEERMRMMGQPVQLPETYGGEELPPVGSPVFIAGGRPGHVHQFEGNTP